jgi:hypothetical protein
MVLKQNRNWQNRGRKKKDDILNVENGHDEATKDTAKQKNKFPKGGITILEMTVPQFASLFMQGYRIAKEEGFTEKDAEDFGVFAATRFAAIWMEDRLAQKKEAEQKAEKKADEEAGNEEENDNE